MEQEENKIVVKKDDVVVCEVDELPIFLSIEEMDKQKYNPLASPKKRQKKVILPKEEEYNKQVKERKLRFVKSHSKETQTEKAGCCIVM